MLFRQQGGNLAIEVGESLLQHLAMPRIGGGFQLVCHACAREPQTFPLLVLRNLLRSEALAWRIWILECVGLLRFDGFAFPAAGHQESIGQKYSLMSCCDPRYSSFVTSTLLIWIAGSIIGCFDPRIAGANVCRRGWAM